MISYYIRSYFNPKQYLYFLEALRWCGRCRRRSFLFSPQQTLLNFRSPPEVWVLLQAFLFFIKRGTFDFWKPCFAVGIATSTFFHPNVYFEKSSVVCSLSNSHYRIQNQNCNKYIYIYIYIPIVNYP